MGDIATGQFGTPTPFDRRAWLWVASIVSLSYSLLTLGARLLAKWELLGIEDGLIVGAYVFGIIHWGLLNRAIVDGLGAADFIADNLGNASRLFFSSRMSLLVAIYLAKLSVLWFARRIFSGTKKSSKRAFEISTGFTAVCGVISVIIASAGCDTHNTLETPQASCNDLPSRWIAITVLDAVTELIMVILPIYIISVSRVKLASKITVITVFALRIPNVGFMIATSVSYANFYRSPSSTTSSVMATSVAVWMEVLLGYSLCSASIPCMRSFLTAFLADGIYRVYETHTGSYGSRSMSRGELGGVVGGSRGGPSGGVGSQRGRAKITSTIDASPNQPMPIEKEGSVASDGSQRIMIKRSVEMEFESSACGPSRGSPVDRNSKSVYLEDPDL